MGWGVCKTAWGVMACNTDAGGESDAESLPLPQFQARPGSVRWLHSPAPFPHMSAPSLLSRYAPMEKLEARQYGVARWGTGRAWGWYRGGLGWLQA